MKKLSIIVLTCLSVSVCATPTRTIRWNNKKAERHNGKALGYPRDYSCGVTANEKENIHFIVKTLADKSLIVIAKERYSLEAAGDRIDHVHPLNFLLVIFSDEEMKVAIRNIRGKGWVWSNFLGGLKDTLNAESQIKNILPYVNDFAAKLNIDPNLILPAIQSKNWDLLVDQLIHYIPRSGDSNRYDF